MWGGGHEVKIMEVRQLGFIEHGTGKHQSNTVYDENGICPSITTIQGGGTQQIKCLVNNNKKIVAMSGRNPQNPSDCTAGNYVEQRLEPNSQGLCNTLTSVQKDNMVLEPIGIGHHPFSKKYEFNGYDNSMSPCLLATDYKAPKTVLVKQATAQGYAECKIGGVADLSYPNSNTRRGRVQENGDVCPTLTATETGVCRIETPYRIRKLTPLECWRLMGFSDEDFRKAEKVNSNTQLYKQAGNSIVVNVLEAIFSQLI